jgi:molybdenum cofactor cytidylyltransferase
MIAAVVPAAGLSRRMGAMKQLLPFAGTTVIGHVVDQILASRVEEVCVVVGNQAESVRRALEGRPVRFAVNPDYETSDMLASIRCGLAALPADCRAILIALGDQPSIAPGLIDAMLDALVTAGRGIIAPVYDQRRGHPLLIDARYRGEILTSYDDVGLRGLLTARADDVFELAAASSAVLCDMDHPEDYERELAREREKHGAGSGEQGE